MFQYLEEMQEDIFSLSVEQIEGKYYDICSTLASSTHAERIKMIQLDSYEESMRIGLRETLKLAESEERQFILSMISIMNGIVGFIFVRSMFRLRKRTMIGLLNGHMILRDRSL